MSYKFENVTLVNKKLPVDVLNFEAPKGAITNLFIGDRAQMKTFTRILRGQEKILKGRYLIDELDLVNRRFIKNRQKFITNDKFFERLVPPKIALTLSLLFDAKYLRRARVKKIDKKYSYKSFVDSGNDMGDMKVRREIDEAVSKFINDFSASETKLLNNFNATITEFNIKQIGEIYKEFLPQTRILAQEAAKVREEIANKELLLTFFQSLYDRVYAFNELRSSCTCEYNAKRSSNKEVQRHHRKFAYGQTKYMVMKQLKFIGIRISELRVEIYRARKFAQQLERELRYETKKHWLANKVEKDARLHLENEVAR